MIDRSMNGCLKGKKDIRDYKFKKQKAMAVQFPAEFRCVNTPEIKNQGNVGSCVAHATSEILEYHDNCEHKLSTNFIYGIHKKLYGSDGPGMYLREACKIAMKYGDPEYDLCPNNTEVEEVYYLAEAAFKNISTRNNASGHRIKGYAKLNSENDVKYALMNYGPVLSCVTWYKGNTTVKGILRKGSEEAGMHAIMIIGWNEKGFICQNSWGKMWGDRGYFVLPYDYKLEESYSFIPYTNDEKDDLVKPSRGNVLDVLYDIINFILNLFNR